MSDQTETEIKTETVAPRRRSWLLPSVLAVLSALFLAGGIVALVEAHQLRSTPAAGNDALVDATATGQVEADVSTALRQILTYDYAKPEATQTSAKQLLRGKARSQYARLFADLQKRAPGEQLTLKAEVRTVGVEELHGTKATLLAFVDQTAKRSTDAQANVAAAQVAVKAEKVGSTWRITDLRPL